MRHLRCARCAKREVRGRYNVPANAHGPAEAYRVIDGYAKQPTAAQRTITIHTSTDVQTTTLDTSYFDCDLCGSPIAPGDRCTTITVWPAARPDPPAWEAEYITLEPRP